MYVGHICKWVWLEVDLRISLKRKVQNSFFMQKGMKFNHKEVASALSNWKNADVKQIILPEEIPEPAVSFLGFADLYHP